jgi:exopolysaccharide production repressor protein
MSFVLFLRGFIGVLLVFAIATYVATHSLWTTVINTVICAVIIQVGYFAAVLLMVSRSPGRDKVGDVVTRKEPAQAAAKKDRQAARQP